ncbi:MAG: formylglycine-generating enzyme family protein [Phycisphaerales bacterium]|nr:formylglycine-generating enzyme family protein [Phycisphaerales bacterium]
MFTSGMGSAALLAAMIGAATSVAIAQPVNPGAITPSTPSIPLTAAALANGVQDRITTSYGIEFVTIGAAGNTGWTGNAPANGRGGVNYDYRIGRYEITTAQWVDFMNAAYSRGPGDRTPYVEIPVFWGAQSDPTYSGPGQRWRVIPGREMMPVGGLSWRNAAVYCNWLHNDQRTDRAAFTNGAYDVRTFGYGGITGERFTDQTTHNADARYWIPTWNEWIKAAHYDPNRNGPGQGGYWNYSNATDQPMFGGPPGQEGINQFGQRGTSQGNFAFYTAAQTEFSILLGAYPDQQSPWGLLDVAGATHEWTEGIYGSVDSPGRVYEGDSWGSVYGDGWANFVGAFGGDLPSYPFYDYGFRIASTVPSPPVVLVGAVAMVWGARRRDRTSVAES